MQKVGLADRADDRVKGYSKGMQQRLMMARCLVNGPDVLFLDEPTDGLDPVSAQAIRQVIREEADRGAAVLLTTHDMDEADKLSDRVAFINEGRIVALDTPENLKLAHGQRSVRVRMRAAGDVREQIISLDAPGAGDRLKEALGSKDSSPSIRKRPPWKPSLSKSPAAVSTHDRPRIAGRHRGGHPA